VFDFRLGRGRDGPKKFLGQFEGILQTDGYGAYDHVGGLERSKPLLEVIRMEAEAARDASLPSSALGKAANYTLSLWRKLTRFLEHPELELSNNLAENSMRPVAQELDPRREPASRAESGSHSVHP
jgi:hypothetical protein